MGLSIILLLLVIGVFLVSYVHTDDVVLAQAEYQNTAVCISSAQDLFKLTDNHYSRVIFRLTNDIDLATDESWHGQVSDSETHGWQPLDTYSMGTCVFDGGGYTLWNLHIDRAGEYSGLLSQNSLHIKNLFFDFTDIKGGQKSAVLAGLNCGTVENVHAKGSVNASVRAGGLIAENFGDIDNCSFDGDVVGRTSGGLIAENSCGIISNSFSGGRVKGHLVGGLIGISGGAGSGEIKTSFSVADVISESFDSTPVRNASFIAVKYETIDIVNCYSLYGMVAVASGDSDGITTLSPTQFLQAKNLIGFDFDNYWTYEAGALEQRTLTVSSNEQNMSGTAVKIIGDRKYYLPQENAVLGLDAGGKHNIGIKSAVINGIERKADFINGNCEFGTVTRQINIAVETSYLIRIDVNLLGYGGMLEPEKSHFAPDEKIVLFAKKVDGYKEPTLTATFLGQELLFENTTTNADVVDGYYRFSADTGVASYSESSLLFVDIHYDVFENVNTFHIDLVVIICAIATAIIVLSVFVTIKLVRRRINEKTKKSAF
jgi:hypothetical protein